MHILPKVPTVAAADNNLAVILNKLWALRHAKIVTLQEIADAVGANERSASDWLTQRRRTPNGETTLKLQSFAARMTLNISRKPNLARKYRAAFEAANVLFPVEGSGEK